MKPIVLQGHERSITQILFNREGDLIFSSAKDPEPSVWFSINGERLGTFKGHNGAVWCLDVDWNTQNVVTGSGDNSCRIWDCSTGKQIHHLTTDSAVRSCGFSYDGNIVMFSTDKAMGYPSSLILVDIRDDAQMSSKGKQNIWKMNVSECSKITKAVWGPISETIITGHEGGEISQYSATSGALIKRLDKAHDGHIMDIQMYKDTTMFVTASKDHTAKLYGAYDLDNLRSYKTERPVNSAALSPLKEHVLLGGGQEAREVTQTSTKQNKFDARFFHMIYAEEFGRVKGHFGPLNSVAFTPDGKGFSTGGEDGLIRMHVFDSEYYNFDIEC